MATSGSAKSFSFASVCGWVGFEIPEGVTDIAQVTLAGLNHLNPIAGEVNISEDLTVIATENNDANNVVLVPAEGQDYIPAGQTVEFVYEIDKLGDLGFINHEGRCSAEVGLAVCWHISD